LQRSVAMRVLREGGEYLRHRERQLWWCFAGGNIALACCGLALVFRQWLVVFAIPPTLLLIRRVVSSLQSVRKGRLGERLVITLLRQLPDTYHLVNDVMVPNGGGNIDHVVTGPCGVVVIETKRLAGNIRCDGDRWYVNGHLRGSISAQVNRGAAALREFFADHHPEIPSGFVRSITVFTHPHCKLKINWARATVVRYSELLQVLGEMGRQPRMSPELAQRLADALARSQLR
jgi:hypothetical protein